ncbi:MAG TPA: glutamate formiminotransferase, partial [Actinomycetota bacterium]|nr:glutamate formiminotransferase [Actinomycetota bacterium]
AQAHRRSLAEVRRGGLEGLAARMANEPVAWAPDFGLPALHPRAGATVIGARFFLVAFNAVLDGGDLAVARAVARAVRASNGGLAALRAIGVYLPSRARAQVSMNLLDYRVTPPAAAYAAVAALAEQAGARVEASEVVGLVPAAALDGVDPADLRLRGDPPGLLLEDRLLRALTMSKERQ